MSRQLSLAWDSITNFRKWLDISGWTRLTYRISYDTYEQTYADNAAELSAVKSTVENIILKNIDSRISQLWVSDYKSYTQQLDNETQIVVEIWWVADLDQAKELIWKTVELEFKLPNNDEWSEADRAERTTLAQNLYNDLLNNSDKFEAIAWARQSENVFYTKYDKVSLSQLPTIYQNNIWVLEEAQEWKISPIMEGNYHSYQYQDLSGNAQNVDMNGYTFFHLISKEEWVRSGVSLNDIIETATTLWATYNQEFDLVKDWIDIDEGSYIIEWNTLKYNNGEKWEDDWDRKKPNKYYSKINFRWEAQLQVAWWSSQAPNSPFAGVNVHSQHRSAAETSIQWSSNVTLTSQSPKNQVGEEMDNENNQIEDAIVISTIFKPKNPIFWWDEKNQWDVIDDNNAQFDWIWVFNNGNFEFEKHIANQNGVISIWNDSFEKLEYIKDEGWQRLSKENFSWKWYMIGKYKFMNWKEEWRDVWYISVWNYKDWLMDWEWKRFFETGSKYEWNWKEGRENWQWKYTYANWDIYEWGFKDGKFEWEWKFIFKSWITITWKFENNNFVSWKLKHGDVAYDIEKDDKWLKITSEWSNNWQYITFNDWHLNIENSKVMIA